MKVLVFRLSSLGDVVLASSALNGFSDGTRVDWVVASEFSEILRGHPRLHALHVFDRRLGTRGWIRFCRGLWERDFERVVDLHGSLRTRMARLFFWWWSRSSGKVTARWVTASKQRWRYLGYFAFKRNWPKGLRPESKTALAARAAGGNGFEKPDLVHLAGRGGGTNGKLPDEVGTLVGSGVSFICVMPSSRWEGKCWPVTQYRDLIQRIGRFPVVLGSEGDSASGELERCLRASGVGFVSGVGRWNLRDVALVLSKSAGYVGNDTGIAHLAEAVGVPALVVFGPTTSEMGFGPWRPGSLSIGGNLWCRPCGKDGRFCFRVCDRFACMRRLKASEIHMERNWVGRHGA